MKKRITYCTVILLLAGCSEPGALYLTDEEETSTSMKDLAMHSSTAKCNDSACHGGEVKVSKRGDLKSHNVGKDCISCHSADGAGRGIFVLAGSVYKPDGETPYPGTVVKLFGGRNGTGGMVASLEVDAEGNFYTTQEVMLADSLFPSVYSENGVVHMPERFNLSMGSCNSCHGVSVGKIFAR